MIEKFLRRPWVVARLRASAFGPDLDALAGELEQRGYTLRTIQSHLHAAGHLAEWLARRRISVRSFDEATIGQFVERHLPHCRCDVPRATAPDVRGVAPHLLKLLRSRGRLPDPQTPTPMPVDALLDAFVTHLRSTRGASSATCECHSREIRPLLHQLYGDGPLDWARMTVTVLRAFVTDRASRYSPSTARRTASALRGFLRFLHVQGLCDGTLVSAIPAVRSSRRSTLPAPLTSEQLHQLLTSIDKTKPARLRDYAILVCLSSLGLRAKEVAELTLDNIDWHAGTITIATSKTRRPSILPLPKVVGLAIAAYLRHGRPATTARHVFVRHLFPVGAPLVSHTVSTAVRRAFRRSGLVVRSRGAHTLRHTVATEMVRAGVSLKAVADVLRHRSVDTTAIYTKIDLPRLREVALAWPEEVQS